jgi:hypothetical protein
LQRVGIRAALLPYQDEGITGVSCIAIGADSIFAQEVLQLGGSLEVVIPASDYRERKVGPDHIELFDELVRQASRVRVMPYSVSGRDAYEAANEGLLDKCDLLLAVWDGLAPVDKGGTAAVVASAKIRGISVEVIWPDGAQRG